MWSLGGPALLDRQAERRSSVELEACHAMLVREGAVLTDDEGPALVAPGHWPHGGTPTFLGRYRDVDVVALGVDDERDIGTVATAAGWVSLRDFARRWGNDESIEREVAATAVAMVAWHERNPMCAVCGEPTDVREAGWSRRCPRDGRDHYPRTDPAVIIQITDEDDRLLLAHVTYHSPRRFSHIAGYVEPGESLEQAVHREVDEEVRLELSSIEYVGSQSWPFPASMMVGFRARAATTDVTVDGVEVEEARFFSREDLASALAAGEVLLAPRGSIARWLVHDWYGEELVGPADVPSA